MKKIKNRWLIALAAIGIHISIGAIYSWSVFTNPISKQLGWGLKQVTFTFSVANIFVGLSAAFMGNFVEKNGPRKSGSLAALLYGLGLLGSGLAIRLASLPLLYLTYGVLGGIGLGIGYIAPIPTLVKWFPDKRGLATGLAIMGFGLASLIAGPVIAFLIPQMGIANTFYILGGSYFLIMFLSSQYLAAPPKGWMPAGFEKDLENSKKTIKKDVVQLTAQEALKTKRFYFLWLMLFINVTCGIAIISVAANMAQEIAGLTTAAAATMVGIMGLFNGAGRIFWASLSDYIGRPNTYIAFFVIQICAFLILPQVTNPLLFQILIFLILTCYGGGFALIPSFIGDLFGTVQVAVIQGYILTAWSAAGLVGPMVVSSIKSKIDSYSLTLYIFASLFALAIVISILTKLDFQRLKKRKEK